MTRRSKCFAARVKLLWLALCLAAPVFGQAQTLRAAADTGLRLQPDVTGVLALPVYGNWSIQSTVHGISPGGYQGLKLGVAGGYGWDFQSDTRLELTAGLSSGERPGLLPAHSVGVSGGQVGGAVLNTERRDFNLSLAFDWHYSDALTLYSGLGLSYSLADAVPNPLPSIARPANSSGFVGLKYRF